MKKLGVGALALAIFAAGAAQKVNATAVLIPYVKAGDGFVTAITYINRGIPTSDNNTSRNATGVVVHFTYQLKNVSDYTAPCVHLDRPEPTTPNDVTTVLFDGNGPIDKPGLFGDTTGMGFTPIYQGEGFLVLENYSVDRNGRVVTCSTVGGTVNATTANCNNNTLTAEAHVLHAATRGVFSIRAIELNHDNATQVSPDPRSVLFQTADTVPLDAYAYNGANRPQATGLHFLPGKLGDTDLAYTSVYAIAVDTAGPTRLTSTNYDVAMRLAFIRTPDGRTNVQGLAGGYGRNEDPVSFLSPDPFMCVANIRIEDIAGLAWTAADLVHTGGWTSLVTLQLTGAQQTNWTDRGITFTNGTAVIPYKIEVLTDSPFGFAGSPSSTAITPLVPQIYAR